MKNVEIVEETTETNDELEETTEEETEEVETEEEETNEDDSDSPTLEDYKRIEKELKTLKAQKDHWRKKATSKPKEKEEFNKSNNYLTRDEAILLAKGFDEDDLTQIKRIAGDGNLVEASNDPLFLSYKKDKEQRIKSEKAQLPASKGNAKGQKPQSEMTTEEHKAYFYKTIGK